MGASAALPGMASRFRGLDRRVPVLAACAFLFVGGRMSLLTFFAVFLGERGLDAGLVGLAILVENVMRALVAPVSGALSDRIGRRPLVLASAIATCGLAPLFLVVREPVGLFAWSAAMGLAQGPVFPVVTSFLIDVAPPERRQSVLALNYTAISIGYTIWVVPAGYLAAVDYRFLAAWSSSAFLGVAVLAVAALRGEPGGHVGAGRPVELLAGSVRAFRDPLFVAFALPALVMPLSIGLFTIALPVYAAESGTGEEVVAAVLGANGVVVAALAIPVNARVERAGPFRHLALAAAIVAVAFVPLAVSAGAPALLAAVIVFSLGEIVFSVAIPSAVAALAAPGARGAYQGAWAMVFALASGSALAIAGPLRGEIGWGGAWAAFGGLTLGAGAAFAAARARLTRLAEARAGRS